MLEWIFNRVKQDNVTIGGSNSARDTINNNYGVSDSSFEQNVEQKLILEYKNQELKDISDKLQKELKFLAKTNERTNSENLVNKMRLAGDFDKSWSEYKKYIKKGFFGNPYIYNVLIMLSEKYSEATLVLAEMQKHQIKPNEYISSSMINKTNGFDEALYVYESLKERDVNDNSYIYNALINKTENEEQALKIYNQAMEKNLVNEYVLSSTLKKIDSYEKSKDLFHHAKSKDISVNNHAYSAILSKNMKFSEAVDFYTDNVAIDCPANEFIYSALASKATSKEEIELFLKLIKNTYIVTNVHIFESLMRNSDNFLEAMGYYEKLLLSGQRPDKHIYTALISKCKKLSEAFNILNLMISNRVDIDSHVIHSVMKTVSCNEDIKEVLEKSDSIGTHLDCHVYTESIKRSSTSAFAMEVYRYALIKGAVLNVYLYTCLMSKVDDFEEVKSIYNDTIVKRISHEWIISSLMSKAKNTYQVEWVLNNIGKYNKGNRVVFPSRYSSVRNGISCIDNMINAGYKPNSKLLSSLYSSPIDDDLTSEEILEFSWKNKLSSFSLNAFVKRASKIDINKSLKILLHYPHLTSGIPIYKRWKHDAIEYFRLNLMNKKYMDDANLALAICYCVNEEYTFALDLLGNITEVTLNSYSDFKRDTIKSLIRKCEDLQCKKS